MARTQLTVIALQLTCLQERAGAYRSSQRGSGVGQVLGLCAELGVRFSCESGLGKSVCVGRAVKVALALRSWCAPGSSGSMAQRGGVGPRSCSKAQELWCGSRSAKAQE